MNFSFFCHALIICYVFFSPIKCQTMLLKDKQKWSTFVDTPNNIVKKSDEESLENYMPVSQMLKPAFVTTMRPKKPFSLSKGIKVPMYTVNVSNGSILPITMKHKNNNMTDIDNALQSMIKVGPNIDNALLSMMIAGLKRQGLVRHEEKISEEKKDSPASRVKEKYLLMSITPHLERPQLPNDNILDMAPAKGTRVRNMRLKGRLCHRHVMFLEGPKYDNKGRPYVRSHQAFIDRVGKAYHFKQTHPPHFLLPSCCNCCKKSIIGCK